MEIERRIGQAGDGGIADAPINENLPSSEESDDHSEASSSDGSEPAEARNVQNEVHVPASQYVLAAVNMLSVVDVVVLVFVFVGILYFVLQTCTEESFSRSLQCGCSSDDKKFNTSEETYCGLERDSCTKQLNTCMTSKETYEVERDSCAEQLNTTTTEREKCKNKIAESIKREKDLDNRLIRLNTSLEVCKTRSEEYRNKRDECIQRENNCKAKIRNLEAEMEFLKSVAKSQRESALVMIMGSITPPPLKGWFWRSPDEEVVPLDLADLTYSDHQWLRKFGIATKGKT